MIKIKGDRMLFEGLFEADRPWTRDDIPMLESLGFEVEDTNGRVSSGDTNSRATFFILYFWRRLLRRGTPGDMGNMDESVGLIGP